MEAESEDVNKSDGADDRDDEESSFRSVWSRLDEEESEGGGAKIASK